MAEEDTSDFDAGRKIFVGGLSFETNNDRFRDFFSKFGEVTDSIIMPDRFTGRSRGFGFITFADGRGAQRVLEEHEKGELMLDGRVLKPTMALPRGAFHNGPGGPMRGSAGDDDGGRRDEHHGSPREGGGHGPVSAQPLDGTGSPTDVDKLYIGGVPYATTDEGFREYFAKFGPLQDCILMRDRSSGRSRGFGFVTFADRPSMERSLAATGDTLDGRNLDIKLAVPQGEMGIIEREKQRARMTSIEPPKKVFVKGLAEETTEDEMRQFFRRFGLIAEVMIIKDRQTKRSRGFGFVTFEHFDAAIHVVNSSKPIRMRDRVVACTVALPKEGGARGGHGYDRGGYNTPTAHPNYDPYHGQYRGGPPPHGPPPHQPFFDPRDRHHPSPRDRRYPSPHHPSPHHHHQGGGGGGGRPHHHSASRSPPRGFEPHRRDHHPPRDHHPRDHHQHHRASPGRSREREHDRAGGRYRDGFHDDRRGGPPMDAPQPRGPPMDAPPPHHGGGGHDRPAPYDDPPEDSRRDAAGHAYGPPPGDGGPPPRQPGVW